jgi:DNA-binding transcriptional regulator LsrR (DeoR family)
MAATGRFGDEDEHILDVVELFRDEKRIEAVKQRLATKGVQITRHRVVALLRTALEKRLVVIRSPDPRKLAPKLASRFPHAKFRVYSSGVRFPQHAARQMLVWLKEIGELHRHSKEAEEPPAPSEPLWIAIGGGKAMAEMIEAAPEVLKADEHKNLRDWYAGEDIRFVNATAGGLAMSPDLEASFLACRFAQVIRDCIGGKDQPGAYVHSPSTGNPHEWELFEGVVQKVSAVVTGVGVAGSGACPPAYCIEAIKKRESLDQDFERRVAGEILFHPFNDRAEEIRRSCIEVRKYLPANNPFKGKRGKANPKSPSSSQGSMLVTLFDFEELRCTEKSSGPKIMVVASCNSQSRVQKARAVRVLLKHGYLTHLCLSASLAKAIDDAEADAQAEAELPEDDEG